MKNCNCLFQVQLILAFMFLSWKCSDSPIEANLDHLNLQIDTLTISDISGENYFVAPNLGSNENLYLGRKSDITIPITFIKIPLANILQPNYWTYVNDTSVTIDSLRFVLFSNDSLLNQDRAPLLYFSPDSQFDENNSTYLDYDDYNINDWVNIGKPSVNIGVDSLTLFTKTQITWDIDTLLETLSDTLDSNLVRTFAIKIDDNDTTDFIEFYSEEASQGENDPQIIMYFRRITPIINDTIVIDTTNVKIYSTGDLSIFYPGIFNHIETNIVGMSNGRGMRTFFQIPSITDSLPNGSIIRNANLSYELANDTSMQDYSLILDPVQQDTTSLDSNIIYAVDPLSTLGYPYRVTGNQVNNRLVFSIKNILQNILLENESNFGFKIVSDEKNEPFHTIWIDINDNINRPKLEILYVHD